MKKSKKDLIILRLFYLVQFKLKNLKAICIVSTSDTSIT